MIDQTTLTTSVDALTTAVTAAVAAIQSPPNATPDTAVLGMVNAVNNQTATLTAAIPVPAPITPAA